MKISQTRIRARGKRAVPVPLQALAMAVSMCFCSGDTRRGPGSRGPRSDLSPTSLRRRLKPGKPLSCKGEWSILLPQTSCLPILPCRRRRRRLFLLTAEPERKPLGCFLPGTHQNSRCLIFIFIFFFVFFSLILIFNFFFCIWFKSSSFLYE